MQLFSFEWTGLVQTEAFALQAPFYIAVSFALFANASLCLHVEAYISLFSALVEVTALTKKPLGLDELVMISTLGL